MCNVGPKLPSYPFLSSFPLATISLFSKSVSFFLFCKFICIISFSFGGILMLFYWSGILSCVHVGGSESLGAVESLPPSSRCFPLTVPSVGFLGQWMTAMLQVPVSSGLSAALGLGFALPPPDQKLFCLPLDWVLGSICIDQRSGTGFQLQDLKGCMVLWGRTK